MSKGKRLEAESVETTSVTFPLPVSLPFGWASVVISGGRLVSVGWENTSGSRCGTSGCGKVAQ
ncbi:MAG: hypothetical protein A2Z40_01775 [Deltaproteobacteria bacterium RBG_19FT_COMBO_60_16]|nr:MAG: hypothetical protein A2Z13_05995 [Deltaproteobacteria bacterium RBG_16_64_85]OGP99664.1 MAG: hypothetical protein A2Z40_01775 [Deltaproteobacteria bacterium RBG_19FT_COMBO_60_16]